MCRYLRQSLTVGLFVVLTVMTCMAKGPAIPEVEAKFSKILKNTKVTSLRPAPVSGLYEVIAGPNVFYYSPEGEGFLVFGQIVDREGKNLTAPVQNRLKSEIQKEQEKKAAAILKTLPLDKAIKIGAGPNIIIEFTDPDCPYCRKVDSFLSKRRDITRYVFLYPLEQLHPNAKLKSIYILKSKNREQAFHDVFSGKYDRAPLPVPGADLLQASEAKDLSEGMRIAQNLGVQGTPLLFVNGKMVNGANIPAIETLLKGK